MTILPSDDAFGIISFSPDSLNHSVREGSGSSVSLTVQRTRGVLGPSTVFWEVSGDGAVDVENTNGFVVLAENTNSTQITIRIKDDVVCIKFPIRFLCVRHFRASTRVVQMSFDRYALSLWKLIGLF